nr:MAG TPA: hypothetical protein [Caudoviricetes sp.]
MPRRLRASPVGIPCFTPPLHLCPGDSPAESQALRLCRSGEAGFRRRAAGVPGGGNGSGGV